MTLTSYSFFEKYFGSEPATSARPPVLINGTASDVTNNTRFISVTPKSDTLFTNTQCIFESLRLSRCTGIRPISRQKYAILCASTVSRISVGCTAHCLRSLYHVMGEQKIPKLSDSDTIFCCRFVETTLLIRFIFQADSVCNQCYKF